MGDELHDGGSRTHANYTFSATIVHAPVEPEVACSQSASQTEDALMHLHQAVAGADTARLTSREPMQGDWLTGASHLHDDVAMVSSCLQKLL
jgi:hypothetical protein